jgi:Fe-S cluster assembly protein SufD
MLTLPTPKLEAWKFTHLKRAIETLPEAATPAPNLREVEQALPIFAVPQIVFKHGQPVAELGTPLPAGVELRNLGTQLSGPQAAPLDALDTLAISRVWELHITATPKVPVAIIHLCGAVPTAFNLTLAAGVQAEVVEAHHARPEQTGWQHHACTINLAEGSHLTHSVLHLLPDMAGLILTRRQRQALAHGATYHGILGTTGGGLVRSELHTQLSTNCKYNLTSLSTARAAQHHDITLQTHHAGEGNTVVIKQRNLQLDESHAVFQGKFYVAQEAQRTNAYMHNHTLLLSDTARSSVKPELEIYADDVKCSHGAASGGLNPQHLFYLQARGLNEAQARALLVQGYADEFLAAFPPTTQRVMRERVNEWLHGGSKAPPPLTDFSTEWLANTKANPEVREVLREFGDTLERPHYERS